MKASVMHEYGAPEVLHYETVPTPVPEPGLVVVQVQAVSINRTLDCRVRAGEYRVRPPLPHVLGNDPAGVISAVGEGVTNVRIGDRVTVRGQLGPCGQCDGCKSGKPGACTHIGILGV